MKVTHLGHAAVLVETDAARILVDPGAFSDDWVGLTGLDAVVITHQHPDHVDAARLPGLLDANPDARVYAEPSVPGAVDIDGISALASGDTVSVGDVEIAAVGGEHAVIHRDIPTIGNIGVVLAAEGEPTLFHPGDSLAACPAGIDLLALPLMGPWAAMKEHIDFVRQIGAAQAFPIHDGLVNERGWKLLTSKIGELGGTSIHDWRDGQAHAVLPH